jgi:hypothetical protein
MSPEVAQETWEMGWLICLVIITRNEKCNPARQYIAEEVML